MDLVASSIVVTGGADLVGSHIVHEMVRGARTSSSTIASGVDARGSWIGRGLTAASRWCGPTCAIPYPCGTRWARLGEAVACLRMGQDTPRLST
jgi:hypothetical protein